MQSIARAPAGSDAAARQQLFCVVHFCGWDFAPMLGMKTRARAGLEIASKSIDASGTHQN